MPYRRDRTRQILTYPRSADNGVFPVFLGGKKGQPGAKHRTTAARVNSPALHAGAENTKFGGYILADASGPDGQLDVILMATGSELSLCLSAYEKLVASGVKARVVSIPSWELFEHQSQEYKDKVIPPTVKARVAVEQAARFGWQRYASSTNAIVGMKTFGASAPLKELTKKFGFTVDAVVATAKQEIERVK